MAQRDPEMPATQTSAPVKPARTTEDVTTPPDRGDSGQAPRREASQEGEVRGDRMPAGADEPGAGL